MPIDKPKGRYSRGKLKKSGETSLGKRFIKDFEDIATGFPTAMKMNAKALVAASRGDYKPAGRIAKNIAVGTAQDLRHPMRHPGNTFLTVLGLASGGGGLAARSAAAAGAASRAARTGRAVRRSNLERGRMEMVAQSSRAGADASTIGKQLGLHPDIAKRIPSSAFARAYMNEMKVGAKHKPGTPAFEAAKKKTARAHEDFLAALQAEGSGALRKGLKAATLRPVYTRSFAGVSKGKGRFPKRYEVNASPNPLVRGARKVTLDPAYNLSRALAEKGKHGGGYAKAIERRTREQQARFARQARGAELDIVRPRKLESGGAEKVWNMPMNLLRMSMYARPRYFTQNLAGTTGLLAMQQPLGIFKSIADTRKLRKTDPEAYQMARSAMGESGASSIGVGSTGALSGATRKAARLANIPESHLRVLSLLYEARRQGVPVEQLGRVIGRPDTAKAQQILARANEGVVDYGRLSGSPTKVGSERFWMRTGLPIFYPMTKGFTRYAARFPAEHSILSALGGQMGMMGKEQQIEDFDGKEPPEWSPYIVKVGKNRFLNPQNVFQFAPGADVLRQATAGVDQPVLSLATNLGPSPELAYALVTGRDLASGFRLRGLEEDADKWEVVKAALKDSGAGVIPGMDYAALAGLTKPRTGAAYKKPTFLEQLGMIGAGPAFTPRRYKRNVLRRQSRKRNAPVRSYPR